jgi:hypothetical protein
MMKKLICALAMAAATAPALAEYRNYDNGIGERLSRLEQRIERGRHSGELTRYEYRRLRNEMRLIARDDYAFRADGRLSHRERQNLQARLDAVSRAVYYELRDGDRRAPHYNDYRAYGRF